MHVATSPHRSLIDDLRRALDGEVDDSIRRRAEYSSDASNYRVVPIAVAFPRTADDLHGLVQWARRTGTPLTLRGGGTSVAGNAIGPGVVVDTSRHLNRILSVDAEARIARVEPGVILTDLQRATRHHGLRFGPDPSTQARATLGGMIGNNACGPHAIAYGRTTDNVHSLVVIDGTGRRFSAGDGVDVVPRLDELVRDRLAVIRTEFGRFGRQASGYSLERLLPENGPSLAKALVGSEGTLVVVAEAELRLVPVVPAPVLVVLGYPTMADAADAVPALLAARPLAVEGLDARLVDVVRRIREATVPDLPRGSGWLMVEVGGRNEGEARAAAEHVVAGAGALASLVVPSGPAAAALWRVREDGAGLAGRTPAGTQAWPGWEDAAVPPERLGRYLRDFGGLMAEYRVDGLSYGHFGDGCVHIRLDLSLESADGVRKFRSFVEDAARLVAGHGGSLSGEHGDGRARSELLPLMYSGAGMEALAAVKSMFDPDGLLNPGVLVSPRPIDTDLRRPAAGPVGYSGGFTFRHDGGDLTRAVHRCVGVGKCRADNLASGGVMCPSYVATKDEKDSTRGRARVLQEVINGSLVTGGFAAPELAESLDLCLSCKACSTDCPAGVDMAQYKSEVLYRRYRNRLRPRSHYALGWLPRWLALPGPLRRAGNVALRSGGLRRVLFAVAGIDQRRSAPLLARHSFRADVARRPPGGWTSLRSAKPTVVLWVDSFSNGFDPEVAHAALQVLASAGYRVGLPRRSVCCGLTWVTTGQLDGARRRLSALLDVLGPPASAGIPIVGLEPPCVAVLRSDLLELLPDDPRSGVVARQVLTLAELLTAPPPRGPGERWRRPDLSGVRIVAQPHCHHHAVMGYRADRQVLERCGADVTVLTGCCGMAGNFGMEREHYNVSVAIAENALLPALQDHPAAVLLADGFSCRAQAADLAGVRGYHLAQLVVGCPRSCR